MFFQDHYERICLFLFGLQSFVAFLRPDTRKWVFGVSE